MDKEQEIVAAALKLFVEFGFHGTPTSKIAREAGVANGTLFHYFKTKEDLIVSLYNRTKENLNDYLTSRQSEQDPVKLKMKSMYAASLEWGLEHRNEFYFIQQFHFSPHLAKVSAEDKEKQTRLHSGLLQEAAKTQMFKPLPVELISSILASHVYGVYQYLLNSELRGKNNEKVIDETFELLWDMLTN